MVFSNDKRLIQVFGQNFPSDKFNEYQQKVREDISRETEQLLREGKTVILDFGFWSKEERSAYIEKARDLNAEPVIYFFNVDKDTLISRLQWRNKNSDQTSLLVTEDMLYKFTEKFEPPSDLEAPVKIIS